MNIILSEASDIFNSHFKVALVLVFISSLFACQTMDEHSKKETYIDDLALEKSAMQNQTIASAINLLEKGKETIAIKKIDRVLRINPNHKTAKLIRKQINQTISQLFPTDRYHEYTIQPADSLGSIAKKWLGNSIYFISLARANQIANPSKIKPGEKIRIPVLSFSPLVKKEKRRSKANIKLIKSAIKNGEYERALRQMNKLYILKSDYEALTTTQLHVLSALSDKAITIPERKQTLVRLANIKETTKRKVLIPPYLHFMNRFEQNIYIDEFLLLFEDKSYRDAAKKLIKAKTIKGFDDNLKRIKQSEIKLISKLHEEAIIFRKKQMLDDALTSWSLIILIDPKNELAIKYHERTLKLLERLKNL